MTDQEYRTHIEKLYLQEDFQEFLCEILVNNTFTEIQTKVIKRVLSCGFESSKLNEEGLNVFYEVTRPFVILRCGQCGEKMRWVEMANAHKRALRCYDCFSSHGTSDVDIYPKTK